MAIFYLFVLKQQTRQTGTTMMWQNTKHRSPKIVMNKLGVVVK